MSVRNTSAPCVIVIIYILQSTTPHLIHHLLTPVATCVNATPANVPVPVNHVVTSVISTPANAAAYVAASPANVAHSATPPTAAAVAFATIILVSAARHAEISLAYVAPLANHIPALVARIVMLENANVASFVVSILANAALCAICLSADAAPCAMLIPANVARCVIPLLANAAPIAASAPVVAVGIASGYPVNVGGQGTRIIKLILNLSIINKITLIGETIVITILPVAEEDAICLLIKIKMMEKIEAKINRILRVEILIVMSIMKNLIKILINPTFVALWKFPIVQTAPKIQKIPAHIATLALFISMHT